MVAAFEMSQVRIHHIWMTSAKCIGAGLSAFDWDYSGKLTNMTLIDLIGFSSLLILLL